MEKEIEALKDKLARACRILEMVGLIDFSGHISGRLPGSQTFFIPPMELSRAKVTPDGMAEVTVTGEQIWGKLRAPDETSLDAAIYQSRPDVNSVIHIHPRYSILPSIVGQDLVPICSRGSIFGGVIPVYGDSDKITTFEQAHRLTQLLGGSRAVIMKGHGAVVAESSIEAVFEAALYLEANARLFIEASALGKPIPLSKEEMKRIAPKVYNSSTIKKAWDYYMGKGRKAGIFWD